VTGVLRAGQHVADIGVRPDADSSGRVDRDWGRVRDKVLVEAVSDGLVAEPLGDPPAERLRDHRTFDEVRLKEGLLEPLKGHLILIR
jgi:hypothetical protein